MIGDAAMPTLQLLNGPKAGIHWPVLGKRFVIGREPGCDAEVTNTSDDSSRQSASVSRKHAVISTDEDRWYIEDGDGDGKKSRNGTFVNDKKLSHPGRRELQDQDRIRICDLRFVFYLEYSSDVSVEASVGHSDSGSCLDSQPADRIRLLLDVSTAFRETLDPEAVLDRTLEHLFKMFPQAQRGMLVFREEPAGPLVIRSLRTRSGDPADPRYSSSVILRCLESMEAVLGNDLPIQFPESESIGGLIGRSLMCTPLWTPAGQALGAIQLDTRADSRKFTPDDLKFLLAVANQASVALSNARLHRETLALQRRTRDLEVAQQVQRALLPRSKPAIPGYRFFTCYESAQEVGGDYYDFIPLAGGRLAVLLGDVAGKGVAAALVVAKFSVEARVCLETAADPASALNRLNALMIRADVPEKYVTLAVAVLDPRTHTVTVVNAGHPSPLLVKANGRVEEVASYDVSGCPIGIEAGHLYSSREVHLQPGDRLLIFSDGVSEAMGPGEVMFGTEGVQSAVAVAGDAPQLTGERLQRAVQAHAAGCEQSDDITVVCFGRIE